MGSDVTYIRGQQPCLPNPHYRPNPGQILAEHLSRFHWHNFKSRDDVKWVHNEEATNGTIGVQFTCCISLLLLEDFFWIPEEVKGNRRSYVFEDSLGCLKNGGQVVVEMQAFRAGVDEFEKDKAAFAVGVPDATHVHWHRADVILAKASYY